MKNLQGKIDLLRPLERCSPETAEPDPAPWKCRRCGGGLPENHVTVGDFCSDYCREEFAKGLYPLR